MHRLTSQVEITFQPFDRQVMSESICFAPRIFALWRREAVSVYNCSACRLHKYIVTFSSFGFVLGGLRRGCLLSRVPTYGNSTGECHPDVPGRPVEKCRLAPPRRKSNQPRLSAGDVSALVASARSNSTRVKDQLLLLSNFVPAVLCCDGQAISSRLKVVVFILLFVFFHKYWGLCDSDEIYMLLVRGLANGFRETYKD